MNNLLSKQLEAGPVICLGMSFENDEARRSYFIEELRKKLQDPEFRKIEGFPIGSDEDILNLSDPPYYTACPNPWITKFIDEWNVEKLGNSDDQDYQCEPFLADISEGKTDRFYKAHTYHTKVPHRAIMRYILHYTQPGDVIYDGFCGSGMVGIAAQMCGNRDAVTSLGFQVGENGKIFSGISSEDKKKSWVHFSDIGARQALLNDLSPAATFTAAKYNSEFDIDRYEEEFSRVLRQLYDEIGWMYETNHSDGKTIGKINYTVWSEIFNCIDCSEEIVFLEQAFDFTRKEVLDEFPCPNCGSLCSKKNMELCFESKYDALTNTMQKYPKRVPVLICYSVGKDVYEKKVDSNDFKIISEIAKLNCPESVPVFSLPEMQMARVGRMKTTFTTHIHKFFIDRQAQSLGRLWELITQIDSNSIRQMMLWTIEQSIPGMSILNRYQSSHFSQVNRQLAGFFYVPSQMSECSPWYNLEGKIKRIIKAFSSVEFTNGSICTFTGDCSKSNIPSNSIDYIFTDPPFGENIYYSDLNLLIEAWHGVRTNAITEAIVDRVKKKSLFDYQILVEKCFLEYYRVLKPGRWITIEFSNTKASVWNSIQAAIANAGFIVSNVSILNKEQGTFQAVNTPTAVKQDLVISAYKPNGGFEERFQKEAKSEEGVWDFTRTHLSYLPVTKSHGSSFQFVLERDPRILFDQMVAYYVRKGYAVPISSREFQIGLAQHFIERDGMYFLPDQVADYDRKRMTMEGLRRNVEIWVKDEASAIDWLRQLIREKPQTFSEITPQFMQQLSGWSKNEAQLDLRELLNQNFLCYDGGSPVPEQIHAYLSTNWKGMRNLSKDDAALIAKARNRWYIPDPNKAGDLEKLRESALLREFEEYKQSERRLRVFRIEAVRAGFRKAWQDRDYAIIVSVAEKIPSNIIEEDPKLLMWYDQAVTRERGE